MADRGAFREFQHFLANRLRASPAQGVQAAWLAVQARGLHYLLPLAQAGEVFPGASPQPVPYTHSWFLGVANLRGSLHGVVDLAAFLDAGEAAPPAAAGSDAPLVAMGPALEVQCALRVDRLSGLRGPEAFVSREPPPAEAPAWRGPLHLDAAGTGWQELDLLALSRCPRFLRIGL